MSYQTIKDMQKVKVEIPRQIKIALNGRTQRWLSFEARIAEQELSKKMNSKATFSEEELSKIQEVLKFEIIK